MGTKKKKVIVFFDEDDVKLLEKKASDIGLSLSAFIRSALVKMIRE